MGKRMRSNISGPSKAQRKAVQKVLFHNESRCTGRKLENVVTDVNIAGAFFGGDFTPARLVMVCFDDFVPLAWQSGFEIEWKFGGPGDRDYVHQRLRDRVDMAMKIRHLTVEEIWRNKQCLVRGAIRGNGHKTKKAKK